MLYGNHSANIPCLKNNDCNDAVKVFIAQEISNEDLCLFWLFLFLLANFYSVCPLDLLKQPLFGMLCDHNLSTLNMVHHREEWDSGVFADGQSLSSISLYSCVCGDYYFPSAQPMALNLQCELTEFYYRLRSLFLLILPSSHLLFLFTNIEHVLRNIRGKIHNKDVYLMKASVIVALGSGMSPLCCYISNMCCCMCHRKWQGSHGLPPSFLVNS